MTRSSGSRRCACRAPRRYRPRAAAVARSDPGCAERRRRADASRPSSSASSPSDRLRAKRSTAAWSAMERDGQLLTNRKGELCVVAKLDLVVGIVQGHPDGFGFLVPEDGGDDCFLSRARNAQGAARRPRGRAQRAARTAAAVRKARSSRCSRAPTREVVGRLFEERGILLHRRRKPADQPGLPGAARRHRRRARSARSSSPTIIEQPAAQPRSRSPASRKCSATRPIPGIEIEIALRKHALPFEFSKEAERQAKRLPTDVRPADRKDRVDLTALPLVTIDGETAKDFDDAVYCERKGRNFRLIVAIADVSHYVRDGDAIDHDARERGTSVYFPRRVIPMLPEELSNELCSLKGERRPPVHGVRHGDHAAGRDQGLPVLSGRHALARAAHVQPGVVVAVGARNGKDAPKRRRCCRTSPICTRSTRCWRRPAKSAARSTSTRSN